MNLIRSIYTATAGTIGLCLALPFACTSHDAMAADDGRYMVVRVIGYDCQGARGPLLASDEDMLPRCATIEAIPPYAVPLTVEAGAE